jgi:hypothetical protein
MPMTEISISLRFFVNHSIAYTFNFVFNFFSFMKKEFARYLCMHHTHTQEVIEKFIKFQCRMMIISIN